MKVGVIVTLYSLSILTIIAGSFFIVPSITGNVIYEPSTAFGCDVAELNTIWDSIFVQDFSEGTIYNQSYSSGVECLSFIMFKNDSSNNIYILVRESGVGEQKTEGYVVLGNETLVNQMRSSINDYISGLNFIQNGLFNIPNIVDRNIQDPNTASAEFDSNFDFSNSSPLILIGDSYTFIEVDTINIPGEGNLQDKSISGFVVFDESFTYFEFVDYTNVQDIRFENDIPDFIFEVNSTWNDAFLFSDHFDFGFDAFLGISSWGSSNVDGILIDFDLDDSDVARFKPEESFIGSKDFVVVVNNSAYSEVSNSFKVTIVEDLPEAPRIYRSFPDILLRENESFTIKLSDYFSDSDGSSITYNYSGGTRLNISISSGNIEVTAKNNFSSFDIFTVGASDGLFLTISPEIQVFLDNSIVKDEGLVDVKFEVKIDGFNITINETGKSYLERDNLKWVVIGSAIFVIFCFIGFLIYYIYTRPKFSLDEKPKAVNSYLEKLKKSGLATSFNSIETNHDKNVKKIVSIEEVKPKKIVVKNIKPILKPNSQVNPVERVKYVSTKTTVPKKGWTVLGSKTAVQTPKVGVKGGVQVLNKAVKKPVQDVKHAVLNSKVVSKAIQFKDRFKQNTRTSKISKDVGDVVNKPIPKSEVLKIGKGASSIVRKPVKK